jgi:hypothetical protein
MAPDLDAGLRAFVRTHLGEPAAIEPVAGTHEDAEVWRIRAETGVRYYLKRPRHGGLVTRERSAYRALGPWLGDAIPELVASADPPIGALLLGEAAGVAYADAGLTPAGALEVHRRLGELRRAFDAAPVDRDPVDPAEAVARRFRHWCERAAAIDAAVLAQLRAAFDPAPLRGMARAWCHRDLGPHNLRIDRGDARLDVRLIDLGRARPDVWLVDVLELGEECWLDRAELRAAYFAGYGREPTPREREGLRALALVHALATAVWGDAHGDAARSQRGRASLRRWLAAP